MLMRLCGVGELSPALQNLRVASEKEVIAEGQIERELNLLRDQFGDENVFAEALASSNLSLGAMREEVASHLRARNWIEKEIAPQLAVAPGEARQFYQLHQDRFLEPVRYRSSHLFLAAPEGSALELIAAQQSAIQGLAVRVLAGEPWAQLIEEASEDEATKQRGGDLGYFAASRVPPEFYAEVAKLQSGQTSAPFRTHLGFHLVQLSDEKAPRNLSFEEARPEIDLELENQKRALAVAQLTRQLIAGDFGRRPR
jgi:parvulin-like peptidyl-prolyl isomerase